MVNFELLLVNCYIVELFLLNNDTTVQVRLFFSFPKRKE